jgi:hypothetical protein
MQKDDGLEPVDLSSRVIGSFRPIDVRLSTAWHIVEGRNAWHSTWTSTFYPKAFALSPETLKKKCENFRTQGSVFFICAAPLALMKSKEEILGITPVNEKGSSTYAHAIDELDRKVFFDNFQYLDGNWLRIFRINGNATIKIGYKPQDFKSFSKGRDYYLGWSAKGSRDYGEFLQFYKSLRRYAKRVSGS